MKEQEALKSLRSAESSYLYARDVLKGRFEKGENAIDWHYELYKEHICNEEFCNSSFGIRS